jgi:protein-S-isoprenylcysteine O-methyltransferase Ste14
VGVARSCWPAWLVLAAALRPAARSRCCRTRADAQLAQTGPYAIVRHPIYSGALLAVFGWAAFVRGPLTLLEALAVLVLLDIKSRREERWLAERFAGYAEYQKRVRKLVPFLY